MKINTTSNIFVATVASLFLLPRATASFGLESIKYEDTHNDTVTKLKGYISIPKSVEDDDSIQVPAVVILPGWGNVNEYVKTRAGMISTDYGWIGFTADIYGSDLHEVDDFNTKAQLSTKYRSDFELFNSRIQAAIDVMSTYPNVDPTKISIIGYCFGGTGALSYSFANVDQNSSSIVGAVSFHGGLLDFDVEGSMINPVLVLSGGEDDTGTAVEELESKLVEANSTWQITRYSGVEHAFTVYGEDAYNPFVDRRSWYEMGTFLQEVYGEIEYGTNPPDEGIDYYVTDSDSDVPIGGSNNSSSTIAGRMGNNKDEVALQTLMYDDNGFPLMGYLATPVNESSTNQTYPAVVIVPNWDGVNGQDGYEAQRAVMVAKEGPYIGMVADVYGVEYTDVEDFQKKIELSTKYRSDPALFVGRIQAAIDLLRQNPNVDSDEIFVSGYCLGGTGSIDYAFAPPNATFDGVKAVVPIHGGLSPLRAIETDDVKPYILVLSGGVDDAHGNTTELEMHLDSANATWEITRFSKAEHGFSEWNSGAYQEIADSRSWWSMMSLFAELIDNTTTTDYDILTDVETAEDKNGDDDNTESSSSSLVIGGSIFTTSIFEATTAVTTLLAAALNIAMFI